MQEKNPINIEDALASGDEIIKYYATKYSKLCGSTSCGWDDFYQEGRLAAITAYQRFDRSKGEWLKYLRSYIKWWLLAFSNKQKNIITTDHRADKLYIKILQLEASGLTRPEILSKLNITEEKYLQIIPISRKDIDLSTILTTSDTIVRDIKLDLTEEEKQIIDLCLENLSIKQIAGQMGWNYRLMSKEINRIFNKIHILYSEQPIPPKPPTKPESGNMTKGG